MKKENKLSSVFSFIAMTSGSIWFGAYIARLLTIQQMFEPVDITLKSYLNSGNLPAVFQTIYPLVNLTFFSYLIFILSFTMFIFTTNLKFKQNGWLLIISMIIFLTLPFELIHLMIDFKLIVLHINEQFAADQILLLIKERISLLSSFPIILLLSYLSIPFFLIVKPFTKDSINEN